MPPKAEEQQQGVNGSWGEAEDLGALGHPQENRSTNFNSKGFYGDNLQLPGTDTLQGTEQGGGGVSHWGGSQGHTSQSTNPFHTCSAHALQLFRAVLLIFFSCPHCSRSLLALKGQLDVGSATPLKGGMENFIFLGKFN